MQVKADAERGWSRWVTQDVDVLWKRLGVFTYLSFLKVFKDVDNPEIQEQKTSSLLVHR
jgi:hypothetical protein